MGRTMPAASLQSRRQFLQGSLALAGVGLLSGCAGLPPQVQQPAKVPRVGFFSIFVERAGPLYQAFEAGLHELGWVDGQNIAIEYRIAEGKADRLPDFAAELVGLKVDVVVAPSARVIRVAKEATGTIPIVMIVTDGADPVEQGFVTSLAHPGGNITGATNISPQLSGKRLELLKQSIPGLSSVAVLSDPANPGTVQSLEELRDAARKLSVQVQSLEVRSPEEIADSFEAAIRERAGALIVIENPLTYIQLAQIVELATRSRLPAMYARRDFVDGGGLMAYGPNAPDLYRGAATYVDKILKGAKPADLPVEQPTKFDFVVNLRTAKALGLTIPESVLQQATELIQ